MVNLMTMQDLFDPDEEGVNIQDAERFNWTPEDFIKKPKRPKQLRYLIAKLEAGDGGGVGEEHDQGGGRIHWQGYCEWKDKVGCLRIKELFDCDWMHLEISGGDKDANGNYVSKEETTIGDIIEWGTPGAKTQGQRADLDNVRDDINDGLAIEDIVDRNFGAYCRYHNGIEKAITLLRKKKNPVPKRREVVVEYHWGVTGAGKSYAAYQHDEDLYSKSLGAGDAKWWGGYDGQATLLIDDFHGEIPLSELKRILDVYPYDCAIKGGMLSHIIYI